MAGVSSDAIASVIVHQADGMLNIAVADPTQANNGSIHIEVAAPAGSVISQDDGVSVDQMTPVIRLTVNVRGSHGKSFRVSLGMAL